MKEKEELDAVYQEMYRSIPEDTSLAEAQEKLIGEIIGEELWLGGG